MKLKIKLTKPRPESQADRGVMTVDVQYHVAIVRDETKKPARYALRAFTEGRQNSIRLSPSRKDAASALKDLNEGFSVEIMQSPTSEIVAALLKKDLVKIV